MTAAVTVSQIFVCSASNSQLKPLRCTKRVFEDHTEHYFSRKSLKYWDRFYKHQNKVPCFTLRYIANYKHLVNLSNSISDGFSFWLQFFKDRHYLEKDWGKYFSDNDDDDSISANGKVLLEVGFGAGNTIFPLIAAYPRLFVHACDFSTEALSLVKAHPNFDGNRINVFTCDVTNEELCNRILPSSVDLVTLIFMLSAVSSNKMPFVLQNLKRILTSASHVLLQPNGHILFRAYAVGDSAQVKLENRNQVISSNFYFRGDGTCSYYFSEAFLSTLFVESGFSVVDMNTYCLRSRESLSRYDLSQALDTCHFQQG